MSIPFVSVWQILFLAFLCGSFVCPLGSMVVPVHAGSSQTGYASSLGTHLNPGHLSTSVKL